MSNTPYINGDAREVVENGGSPGEPSVSPVPPASASGAPAYRTVAPSAQHIISPQPVSLRINGQTHELLLEPRVTLLDALREIVGLTGTKKGCDRGQCGACTVLVDGQRINSCLTLAIMNDGREITTVEGLGQHAEAAIEKHSGQAQSGAAPVVRLHPVQQAFLEHDAFQCGYCTPGQICATVALLAEWQAGHASAVTKNIADADASGPRAISDDEIRERMSGNLCRCGAYVNIVAAIRAAANGAH